MKDLTMDACVLFDANGVGELSHQEPSLRLMEGMKEGRETVLALDDEDLIATQWRNNIDVQSYALKWVEEMALNGKIHYVHRARIDRKTSKLLREASFDTEDYNYYVRTAAASDYKRIISRDFRDYSSRVQKILKKRLRLRVSNAQNTCDILDL